MPREVFVAGQILTAAEMNSVSDQTVMVFAGTAARGSAIPTPSEGMVTYLSDSDDVEVFDGSVYKAVGPGKILQVVSTTKTDPFTTSSTSLVDVTGLTATITPSSATSKILVVVGLALNSTISNAGSMGVVLRNSTIIGAGAPVGSRPAGSFFFRDTTSSSANGAGVQAYNHLDSPATTSAVTYKVQVSCESGTTATVNRGPSNDNDAANFPRLASFITLMEVAA